MECLLPCRKRLGHGMLISSLLDPASNDVSLKQRGDRIPTQPLPMCIGISSPFVSLQLPRPLLREREREMFDDDD
jgi:hypothetical protein